MEEGTQRRERGQSIVIIAVALIVLLLFAVVAVDLAYGYVHRRGDQNAADAAALAGARELANILNANGGSLEGKFKSETPIRKAMNDFAERNGIEDTDGELGDTKNTNVMGFYLNANGDRISEEGAPIAIGQTGPVHKDARGIEAIVYSVAPSFFGGLVGLDGLPIQAESAVVLNQGVCHAGCVAPIATLWEDFQFGQCYEIWDGAKTTGPPGTTPEGKVCAGDETVSCETTDDCYFGTCGHNDKCSNKASRSCDSDDDCNLGLCVEQPTHQGANFGWLNWTWQGHACKDVEGENLPDDCGTPCLAYHLRHDSLCDNGMIDVYDWVGGMSGIHNANAVQNALDWYIDEPPESFTIIVYDEYGQPYAENSGNPQCARVKVNNDGTETKQGFGYHVVGFARFQPVGYELSSGGGSGREPPESWNGQPLNCPEWTSEKGNKIAGIFIEWVTADGIGGDCDDYGISAPQMTK